MSGEWLKAQLEAGRSLAAIGELAGLDATTVGYWVRKHGLQAVNHARHVSRGGLTKRELELLVEEGLSMRAMAARLGVSPSTVSHWMKKHGLRSTAYVRHPPAVGKPKTIERVCRTHGRTVFVRSGRAGYYRCKKCRAAAVSARRRRVKEILVAEAGGRCRRCGYDRYVGALQFHHLEPGAKVFGVSQEGATRAIAEVRTEVEKCVLLCANCHAEVEGGFTKLELAS